MAGIFGAGTGPDAGTRMMAMWKHLLGAPMEAISHWDSWIGFAAMEYAGDFVQTAVGDALPDDSMMTAPLKAIVRGGILTTNLVFWDNNAASSAAMGGYAY